MDDRRKLERPNLAFFTRLFDRDTGRLLGYLANLTDEGVMLIGDEPLEAGRSFRIRMELDEAILHHKHLDFDARCLWCTPDPLSSQFFNAGFQLMQIKPEDLDIIKRITHEYRLRG